MKALKEHPRQNSGERQMRTLGESELGAVARDGKSVEKRFLGIERLENSRAAYSRRSSPMARSTLDKYLYETLYNKRNNEKIAEIF